MSLSLSLSLRGGIRLLRNVSGVQSLIQFDPHLSFFIIFPTQHTIFLLIFSPNQLIHGLVTHLFFYDYSNFLFNFTYIYIRDIIFVSTTNNNLKKISIISISNNMTWPLLKIKSSRKKQNKHMKNMSFSLPAAASDAGFFYSLFFLLDLYTT